MKRKDAMVTEQDLDQVAKLAGITLTPANRSAVLATLRDLREGVLSLSDKIGDDAIPAVRFSAE